MKRNEKIYFEGFKRTNISEKELKNAKKKTSFLREKEEKLLLLVRMVKAILKGEYRIALGSLALLIATVIYVISLIYKASYFVAFIGWLDDISVAGIIFRILEYIMSKFEKYKIALGSLALLIAAVIYVISLIYKASYFVAFIGWLDDVSVVAGIIFRILKYIMSNFEKYEKEKNKMQELN